MKKIENIKTDLLTYKQDRINRGDLKALAQMVPRLAVVTHVDLPGIEDRARFSDQVRAACEKLGVPVFSPADHVGPDDMLDANHYKPDVVRRIGDRLMEFMQCKPET